MHFLSAITLKRKRKLVALLLSTYICIVTINTLWLFLTELQCVIVVLPDHTYLRFAIYCDQHFCIGICIESVLG